MTARPPTMSPALRIAFALAFLVIASDAIMSYRNAERLLSEGKWVSHTQEVRVALRGLLSGIQDAETGERGFLITGDEEYLVPYVTAPGATSQAVRALRKLVADNPAQLERLEALQPHIDAKLTELRYLVELRRRDGQDAAQHAMQSGSGLREMDAIRTGIAEMEREEDELLHERVRAVDTAAWTTVATFSVATVFAAALIGLLYALLRRYILTRETADAEREKLLAREQEARRNAEEGHGRLQEANRAKDAFLATVSHELRTPLSPILAWTAILQKGSLDAEQSKKALETIRRCARAQAQLIEDLLDVSRIIAGKMRLEIQPVDLRSTIEAAVDVVRPAADAKDIRLQVILDTKTAPISGDPERLQQVMWNLLSNAVKFTPKGGRVTVVLERVNSHVEIAVSDTGRGIEPAFMPFIFERFQQADTSSTRQFAGLGLGLAIVRHIVEAHGGTVHAESPGRNEGAVFTLKLPLVLIPRAAGETLRRHPTDVPLAQAAFPSLQGLRVLVVDDEPDSNEVVRTLLASCGAEVRVAASAAQALDILDAHFKPDVVVSDIGMPEEDGYSLLARVRARTDGAAHIPIIALTAYASIDDRVRLLSAGFAMHVAKPIEPAELLAVVVRAAPRVLANL